MRGTPAHLEAEAALGSRPAASGIPVGSAVHPKEVWLLLLNSSMEEYVWYLGELQDIS